MPWLLFGERVLVPYWYWILGPFIAAVWISWRLVDKKYKSEDEIK